VAQTRGQFAVEKARYQAAQDAARRQAAITFAPIMGASFTITNTSRAAFEAVTKQWRGVRAPHAEGGWDWLEIHRRYRDMTAMGVAMWMEPRLCGMALIVAEGRAAKLAFIEGDPRQDCPLKGRRLLVGLECAANYAQKLGKPEIRVNPANEELRQLYESTYGFRLVNRRGSVPYWVKEI
jgi:hypothetical protein